LGAGLEKNSSVSCAIKFELKRGIKKTVISRF